MGDPAREPHLGSVLRYALAAASLGAGLIHVTAAFDHVGHTAQVVFFVVVAAVQLGWAVAVVRRPARPLLAAGAALSAGVVLVWLVSRTTGLPGVPGAEQAEPFGVKDGVSSGLEALLVAGVGTLLPAGARGLGLASGRLASGLAVSVIGLLTAAGLSAPGHHHRDHDEAGHSHAGGLAAATGHHDDEGSAAQGRDTGAATDDYHAGSGHPHDDGHHGGAAPGHVHGDGHDADTAGMLALVAGDADAGDADHDHHHIPGHVHSPGHIHTASSGAHGHEAGHDQGTTMRRRRQEAGPGTTTPPPPVTVATATTTRAVTTTTATATTTAATIRTPA